MKIQQFKKSTYWVIMLVIIWCSLPVAGVGQSFENMRIFVQELSANGQLGVGITGASQFGIWENGAVSSFALPAGGGGVNDISNNKIVVGYLNRTNYIVAFKWQDNEFITLKSSPNTDRDEARYITPDGTVIVGTSRLAHDFGGQTQIVLWKDDDVFELGCPNDSSSCFPVGISADGEVILVRSGGNFIWNNGNWIDLGIPAGYESFEATALSSNGKVVVGDARIGQEQFGIRMEWETGEFTVINLDTEREIRRSSLYTVSADGSAIGGAGGSGSDNAHLWREGQGSSNIRTILAQSGISTEGWYLGPIHHLSDDGRVVVGRGIAPGDNPVSGWVAVLGPGGNEPIQVNSIADRPQTPGQTNCNTGHFVESDGEDIPECTLRAAIETLNERAQADSISFTIDGGGSHIIELGSALPVSDYPIVLDATTQPGYNGFPMISINGMEIIENGLVLTEGESAVRGFSIGGFTNSGILISGGSENRIEANHIGINAAGTSPFPNRIGMIIEESSNNQIGGTDPTQMNVISGNTDARPDIKMREELTGIGIMIRGSGSSGNLIQGNRVGTDYGGQQAVGNGYTGIYLYKAPSNEIGGDEEAMGNLISGNATANLQISGSEAVENIVTGNLIGTNADGTRSLSGEGSGITIAYGSRNRIGGPVDTPGTAPGNIISGHGSAGIVIVGITPEAVESGSEGEAGIASDNVIGGNLIGTAINGTTRLPNEIGILAGYDAHKTQIGGSSGLRNIISGNQSAGIILADSTGGLAPHETVIAGNYIGTDITGNEALGNGGPGILFATLGLTMTATTGIAGVTIGGLGESAGNVIAGNADHQIEIFGPMSAGTQILNNSVGILANGQPGQDPGSSEFGILVKSDEILIGADIDGNEAGNTIGGNQYGILLAGSQNLAVSNKIGTNPSGTSANPNEVGIWVLGSGNHILNNTISGNSRYGVMVGQESGDTGGFEGQFFDPEMTVIVNNMIGTNTQGSNSIGNGLGEEGAGVVFWRGKSLHMYLNMISGNYHGVHIDNSQFEEGTRMAGNLIGAGGIIPSQIDGVDNTLPEFIPIPNQGDGVHVTNGRVYLNHQISYAPYSEIALGNYIQNNLGAGIRRTGSNLSTDLEITSNYFFGNGGLSIDVDPAGAGVSGDMHSPPVLLPPVFSRENQARIRGNSSVNGTVQFYTTPICHTTGFGEGRLYLNGRDRNVSAGQEFLLEIENPENMHIGFYITALITSGNRTSEFSQCVRIADEDLYQEGLLDDLATSALELLELTLTLDEEQPKAVSSQANSKRNSEGTVYAVKHTLPPDNNQFEGSATGHAGSLIEPDTLEVNQYWTLFADTEEEISYQVCIDITDLNLENDHEDLVVLFRGHPGEPWIPFNTSLEENDTHLCASGLSGFGEFALGIQSDLSSTPGPGFAPFITTWKTDNPGTSDGQSIAIPMIAGGYDFTVDWGDGSSEDHNNNSGEGVGHYLTHTYASPGVYEVKITGDFPRIAFYNLADKDKILEVNQWGDIEWSSMEYAFYGASNLNITAEDAPDLSGVTSLREMFREAASFNGEIGHWNTETIENMESMFQDAGSFNQDLNSWQVNNVTTMHRMFQNAHSFNQDLNSWNTGNVTRMSGTFRGASAFNGNISGWNTSNVTIMQTMFRDASAFNQNISGWDVNSVEVMDRLFINAETFNQNLGSWEISSIESMEEMFDNSGLSVQSYDATLTGWSSFVEVNNGPENIELGAAGRTYCMSTDARRTLIENHGWVITGDSESTDCESIQIFSEVTLTGPESWRMLTLPDQSQSLGDFFGDFANHAAFNLFTFDQTAYDWDETISLSTVPGPGKAFIVYVFDEDLPVTLEAAGDWLPMDGTFTYSGLGFDDSSTDNHYMIGNPHPVVLDYCEMIGTSRAMNYSIWFWDPGSGYVDFNCHVDEAFIAPYQGFWVYTDDVSPELGVPAEAYSNQPQDGYFKEQNQSVEEHLLLTLRVENIQSDLASSARFLYNSDAKEAMDVMDTPYLSSAELMQTWISFYSVGEDQNRYSLQALPENHLQDTRSIPLVAESNLPGSYRISWTLPPKYLYDGNFYLKDLVTGAVADLNQSGVYNFEISEEQAAKVYRGTTESGGAGMHSNMTRSPHSAIGSSQVQPRFELIVSPDGSGIPGDESAILPESYALSQNYPNPFNPSTIISYELPQSGQVRLEVFDMTGRQITTLVNSEISAGTHQVTFDASHLSSGIYMYRLQAGGQVLTRKLTVLK